VEKTAFIGTERIVGYCGGSHHRIFLFNITLDSFFTELVEEENWIEWRLEFISEKSIKNYSEFGSDQCFIFQFYFTMANLENS